MNAIEKKLYKINPVYLSDYEDMIKSHAQFGGGAADTKFTGGKSFSNVYEFYIYAFFIGLYKGLKQELVDDDKTKTFWEMESWKPRELVDYLLVCAIGQSKFDMIKIEKADDQEVVEQVKLLKQIIEQYANGGLKYISEILQEQEDLVDDHAFFIKMLSECVDN